MNSVRQISEKRKKREGKFKAEVIKMFRDKKVMLTTAALFVFVSSLCLGAVVWKDSLYYGNQGTKKMRVEKVFDGVTLTTGVTTSSKWYGLDPYSYIAVLSFVRDDPGTSAEAVTLTYNTSTDPGRNQNGTTTIYTSVGTDANGNWRDDSLELSPMPFIRFHATPGATDTVYDLHLTRAD